MHGRFDRQILHVDLCEDTAAALDAWIETQGDQDMLSREEAARRLLSERLDQMPHLQTERQSELV